MRESVRGFKRRDPQKCERYSNAPVNKACSGGAYRNGERRKIQ